jgi:hypothetical protein
VRKLALYACTLVSAALAAVAVVGMAGAAPPKVGTLSVDQGKGQVIVELKGNLLGRLTNGTVRIIDLTPRDRFVPLVGGRRLTVTRVGPRTTVYKGRDLRYRMLGGRWKIVVKGNGIAISAVGRGAVTVDGDRRLPEDNAGVYSLDGLDCGLDPTLCTPLPDNPERYPIGPRPAASSGSSAR